MEESIHPIFRDKPDDDSKLWRYISLPKLVNLLDTDSIHFTRLDKFSDHFEGAWTKQDLLHLNSMEGFNIPSFTYSQRTKIAVSCWHENSYESAAMWGLYNPNNEGVAIQTTFGKLQTSFDSFMGQITEGLSLYGMGRVQYLDSFKDGLIKEGEALPNTFYPFMLKNISYHHEKEVRALVASDIEHEIADEGFKVTMPINETIERIIVNPFAPQWFFDAVESLLKKYNFNGKLENSSLAKASFYMKVSKKEPVEI